MPGNTDTGEMLRKLTDDLVDLRADLAKLSEAVWLDIDHENPEALEAGVRFKQRYNEQRRLVEEGFANLLALFDGYADNQADGKPSLPESKPERPVEPTSEKPVAQTEDRPGTPSLLGDLKQKEPFGFILHKRNFTTAAEWSLFYEAVLQELFADAPENLLRLARTPDALTYQNAPLFAASPEPLSLPLHIADQLFAEGKLDAETSLQVIRRLILERGDSLDSFKILLREKNRGTVETRSIAA